MITQMLALQTVCAFIMATAIAAECSTGKIDLVCVLSGLFFAFAPIGGIYAAHGLVHWAFG